MYLSQDTLLVWPFLIVLTPAAQEFLQTGLSCYFVGIFYSNCLFRLGKHWRKIKLWQIQMQFNRHSKGECFSKNLKKKRKKGYWHVKQSGKTLKTKCYFAKNFTLSLRICWAEMPGSKWRGRAWCVHSASLLRWWRLPQPPCGQTAELG